MALALANLCLATWLPAAQAASVPIVARIAQHGSFAGIRDTLFTTWLPPGSAFAGLSGRIALAGNHPGFSEALILVGVLPGGQAACAARNGAVVVDQKIPRLWAGILKSNDTALVGIPVSVSLRWPMALSKPGTGACLTTLVSAGYPFLRRDMALYTTTEVQLTADIIGAQPGDRPRVAFGIGGEFKFVTGAAVPQAGYVGLQANRRLRLDSIAASVSAAPVGGAPPKAGWGPNITGDWRVATDFLYLPAAGCRAARLEGHPAGADFSVLRLPSPAFVAPPPGSMVLMRTPVRGRGLQAAQYAGFQAAATAGWPAALEVGDCLLAWQAVIAGAQTGSLDVENQSTVYFKADPSPG